MEIGGKKTFINFSQQSESVQQSDSNEAYLFRTGENRYTTMSVGEEGGDNFFERPEPVDFGRMTTHSMGEEGGDGMSTTMALGEEGGDGMATTMAMGEEGGLQLEPHHPHQPEPRDLTRMTSMSMGEEGGGEGMSTTMALGEEGGVFEPIEINPITVSTMAMGEEGGENFFEFSAVVNMADFDDVASNAFADENNGIFGSVEIDPISVTTTSMGEEGGHNSETGANHDSNKPSNTLGGFSFNELTSVIEKFLKHIMKETSEEEEAPSME